MKPGATSIGIVLAHGWLGAPGDLAPLASHLVGRYGDAAVDNLCLPGHDDDAQPPFMESEFLATLATAIDRRRGQPLVLIGHSTGGSLLLAEIRRRLALRPASLEGLLLLVLCATPPRVDLGYTQRWGKHTSDRTLALHDLGALVALVNGLARRAPLALPAPTLIVQGEDDELVPGAAADLWPDLLHGALRQVRVAGAKHHLFTGKGARLAIDAIDRAIDDARRRTEVPEALRELEPGLAAFAARWPDSARQLAEGPAAARALLRQFAPTPTAGCEPTLANIEITTRCNLGCAACARTQLKLQSRFMDGNTFAATLAALPHAWRINLVGLGEPLLHPQAIDYIRLAAAQGRRVGLVTNAMNLDADLATALCASGLSGITFSIDAVTRTTAERVRKGSDMALIAEHIRGFIEARQRHGVKLGVAIFTALGGENLGEFEAIVEFAADLGVDALMLTDLNFPSNQARSLHATFTPERARLFRQALKRAVARRLPVLSVWGLEEYALAARHLDYLLLRGEQLARRTPRHSHCLSPWQTVPVNVEGKLTICDCQPGAVIGNILDTPLAEWWNGPAMREQRRQMLSDHPPEACRVCPRF